MKPKIYTYSVIALILFSFIACFKSPDPVCKIITPPDNLAILLGDTITLTVEVDFHNSEVWQVDLLLNDQGGWIDFQPPFTFKVPTKLYTAGEHKFTVRASSYDGETLYDEITINLYELVPEAQFSCDVVSGESMLSVRFHDQSTNRPTSWFWEFGDSTTTTNQNHWHFYKNPGVYTVSLTVSNGAGSNTITKEQLITVW